MTADGLQVKTTDEVFKGKKVALFAVPGAYTGTCHKMHLPSIFLNAYAMKDKGVNTIAIVSVNDAFVMNAWKRDTDQRDEAPSSPTQCRIHQGDRHGVDASGNGLGIRSHRYSMLVDDGVVKKLNLEPAPAGGGFRRRYAAGAAVSFLRRSGARAQASEPGISRFRVWC